ncbi:MAG: hypothetical protein IT306_26115 [Chloroflexi bacterium]|nr:hypothetical protein [Chloroflexota bacterium]
MKPRPPASLLLMTIGSLVLVNVVAAQLILKLAYPSVGAQFNWGILLLLLSATIVLGWKTVIRWRAYLRLARAWKRRAGA